MVEEVLDTSGSLWYHVLLFLFILLASVAVGNICYSLLRRFLDGRISRSNSKLLANIIQYGIIFLGLYYGIRDILNFNLGELGASLGILTIVIAFSSREIIQNILSGFLLLLNRPIRLEDWIIVGGFPSTGVSKVVDISLMNTVLREIDGRLIILPNSSLLTQKIINYTRSGLSMVQIPLQVPLSLDLLPLQSIVREIASNDPLIMPSELIREVPVLQRMFMLPFEKKTLYETWKAEMFAPEIFLSGISGSHKDVVIRIWIHKVQKKDEIISKFLQQLLIEMQKQGISLKKVD